MVHASGTSYFTFNDNLGRWSAGLPFYAWSEGDDIDEELMWSLELASPMARWDAASIDHAIIYSELLILTTLEMLPPILH
jgi:hypothetical protein